MIFQTILTTTFVLGMLTGLIYDEWEINSWKVILVCGIGYVLFKI